MKWTACSFVRRMRGHADSVPTTEFTTSTTQPFVNTANVDLGNVLYAAGLATFEVPKPYYSYGDTVWRGPLGDVHLTSNNEFNIEDNGAYSTPQDGLIMVQCLLEAYKMMLTTPPGMRPRP